MKKLFTLVAIAITLISTAQESVLLRMNYNKGDQYLVTMNMEQGEMMSMKIDMSLDVKDIQDTIFDIDMAIKGIKMDVSQGGQIISFDSSMSDDELDEMGKMMKSKFAPMMLANIMTKTTHRAETIETIIEPEVAGMDQFTNNSGSVVYPKEAVKIDESWTVTKLEKGMDMTMIYTVKSIEKDIVNIEISGTIELLAEGTISGNMEIDKTTGNVNYSIMNMNMNAGGQEINMKISMTSTKQ